MGYVSLIAPCCACGKLFGFNPKRVPSYTINGKREPVCRECIEEANRRWIAQGEREFVIHPDAYLPVTEAELANWSPPAASGKPKKSALAQQTAKRKKRKGKP